MSLSQQQGQAIKAIVNWAKNETSRKQVFRLFGYAGVGKTTIARNIPGGLNKRIQFMAYTGKAAHVLRQKGCYNAMTIHRTIYQPYEDPHTKEVLFRLLPHWQLSHIDMFVVDEVSMVDEKLGRDLMSFRKPILVIGDPAQLPPVKGTGFFTNKTPDFMLTEIHRQAKDNPIISLSEKIRNGHRIQLKDNTAETEVIEKSKITEEHYELTNQVICGTNKTRATINNYYREAAGYDSIYPDVGDKLVCLKNNHKEGILNGELFLVTKKTEKAHFSGKYWRVFAAKEDDELNKRSYRVHHACFDPAMDIKSLEWREISGTDQFDYGYALTCHKSQGSQWDHVMLYDESSVFREDSREWLYTAITRASERLTIAI